MEAINPEAFAHALNRVLKRLADAGWVESSAITTAGQMHVQYSEHGTTRMRQLREIIVEELHVTLTFDEFHALVALLVRFGQSGTTRPE
jgi:DNA-binding MarR family transcriptional regulator